MNYVLFFFLYSFIGWLWEVILFTFVYKKPMNRGFLLGPVCPVYGIGGVVITLLLSKYRTDILALFCMSFLSCTIIEYFTSYILEKLFSARWWDYSTDVLNINGRVCLICSIGFGLAGVFLINFFNPLVLNVFNKINIGFKFTLCFFFLLIFFIDICITVGALSKLKKVIEASSNNYRKDNTEKLRNLVLGELSKKTYIIRRLSKIFPNFRIINKKGK